MTLKLLEDMGIASFVIGKETTDAQLAEAMQRFRPLLEKGLDVAFVVRKGALSYDGKVKYQNDYPLKREEIIRRITAVSGNDPIVSTTGKASRELFEIRTAAGETHARDFLTVGSMGHSSSIARACGYAYAASVCDADALDKELAAARERDALSLIEVKCAIGARDDLGRPTTTALENKQNFMQYLRTL